MIRHGQTVRVQCVQSGRHIIDPFSHVHEILANQLHNFYIHIGPVLPGEDLLVSHCVREQLLLDVAQFLERNSGPSVLPQRDLEALISAAKRS